MQYFLGSGLDKYGFTVGNIIPLYMLIPDKMADYILNLKSYGDFNGIMESFDNLLGARLNLFVANVPDAKVELDEWL